MGPAKSTLISCSLLTFLLLVCQIAYVQSSEFNQPLCKSVQTAIQPYAESDTFSGNVLLAKNGKVLCQYSHGFSDKRRKRSVVSSDRFPIASLSKPLIATLALKLQEKGLLDLNATVEHYLSNFSAPWAIKVTVHHLLANRSGLPGHFVLSGFRDGKYNKALSKHTLLKDIAQLPLSFEPGTDYLYTNLGWTLLAEIIEGVTSKDLQDNLMKHLFAPLEMKQSGLVINAKQPLVAGFQWGPKGNWQQQKSLPIELFKGGAGVYTSTTDLLKYLHALHHGDLLSTKSKQLMFAADTPYGWRNETVYLGDSSQKRVYSYDGQLLGHSSFVYQERDENVSLIILANSSMGFAHKKALADDILSVYFKKAHPNRSNFPSLILHKSLVNGQWDTVLSEKRKNTIKNEQHALLLLDLAQQLEWSGNTTQAIDLYAWLIASFPENQGLKNRLVRLCQQLVEHKSCPTEDPINVGMMVLTLEDASRNAWRSNAPRPITTHIFYPTEEQEIEPFMLGPEHAPMFNAGEVVHDGKLMSGKRPLVLMSHGTGGSAPQLLWLATALVKQGYVVAAVNHHGNTAIENQKYPEGFLLWWERARDLQFVREHLLQNKQWEKAINPEKTAVVGFSLGGYTAVSALGGITDKAQFDAYCENASDDFSCQAQPEFQTVLEEFEVIKHSAQVVESQQREHNSNKLPNLKAAVVIAPAIMHAFRPNSLQDITTPTLFIIGDKDKIAPSKPNAEYANALLKNSQLSVIRNADHYSFLSNCTERGKRVLDLLCEEPYGMARSEVHRQAIQQTVSFLHQYL